MVSQIITYQTEEPATEALTGVLSEMKKYYLDNGCIAYEVFRDTADHNKIIEIARFENREMAEKFDKTSSAEKDALFNKFCAASRVVAATVEVKLIEQIA